MVDPERSMSEESESQRPPEQPTREQEIARRAARLVKTSKPQLKRLIAYTRPRAENAGREAAKYVREHETEIKDAALKLARTRLPGPLGMAVGAIANSAASDKGREPQACPNCKTANAPAARFCSECGTKLDSSSDQG
jgi:hypothetical protein